MNAVVMAHKESLPFLEMAAPLWRKTCGRVLVIANTGCPESFDWADDVFLWPRDPGQRGLEHCKRLFHGIEMAARMDGYTALSEADGLMVHGFDFKPGIFYGSQIQSNLIHRRIIPNPYREYTLFCPWVTDRAGWIAIAAVLRGWLASDWLPDEGYADRVVAAAALDCGLVLSGVGFNRWPRILRQDQTILTRRIVSGDAPLVHAIKELSHLAWIAEAATTQMCSTSRS